MLDLGATVCRARVPACDGCPVADSCAWHLAGALEPDPARGSAGVSRGQSRFEGSDRQGRGRLVAALTARPHILPTEIALVAGWPDDVERATRAADALVDDGVVVRAADGSLRLP